MEKQGLVRKLLWLTIFGIAMGYLEGAVVVYLRAIYYPEGFGFPLKEMADYKIVIEVFREVATILMLLAVSMLAGKGRMERFAHFIIIFGIWDIVYYISLKLTLDWPASIFEWDILFLIPLPWIGPVIAPVLISILFIVSGISISWLINKGYEFKTTIISYIMVFLGTILILYSFMNDTSATLHHQIPKPYQYELFIIGYICFIIAFAHSLRRTLSKPCMDIKYCSL